MSTALTPHDFQGEALLLAPEWTLIDEVAQTGQAVLIRNGVFEAVGPAEALRQQYPHLAMQALPQRLLMPGLIDTHNHLTQSYGKALAFGEPSEIFKRIWVPLEQHLTEEDLYLSAKLASLESLRGGFTTVCDAGTRSSAGLNQASACSMAATMLRWVRTAPLDRPVVPPVYCRKAMSSMPWGVGLSVRLRPRAMA